MIIRKIQSKDNFQMGTIVQQVLLELGAPKIGTAYSDPYLFSMFENYDKPKAIYFVIENDGEIIGGAGIDQLEKDSEQICEVQKMYFLPKARGLGLGLQIIEKCLQKATIFGYESCYLETMTYMTEAQKLYTKVGFKYLDQPLGNTGHTSCHVWMLKKLISDL